MRVGFIGLGKLGLPVAAAVASKGHEVYGTDVNRDVEGYIANCKTPYQEDGLDELLARVRVVWRDSIEEVVADTDLVFIAVQTPHSAQYEGVTPAPEQRSDFEYGYLENAYRQVCQAASVNHAITVAVISTVLPGTMHKRILPHETPYVNTVYNPFFIAMGTTIADFLDPEFVIVGGTANRLAGFYASIHQRPVVRTSIESAELVKMAYNSVISTKIVLANWIGEICDKTGADADEVHQALSHATRRLWSPAYFKAGMGDGGGCHPRDNIALSYLAERLDLSVDVGGWVTEAREQHIEWLASIVNHWNELTGLPVKICGREYKPESNITVGSPARLLAGKTNWSRWRDQWQDIEPTEPAVFFIGCQHQCYAEWRWPRRSVVIDPFGYIADQPGVTLVRIGRK